MLQCCQLLWLLPLLFEMRYYHTISVHISVRAEQSMAPFAMCHWCSAKVGSLKYLQFVPSSIPKHPTASKPRWFLSDLSVDMDFWYAMSDPQHTCMVTNAMSDPQHLQLCHVVSKSRRRPSQKNSNRLLFLQGWRAEFLPTIKKRPFAWGLAYGFSGPLCFA